VKTLLRSTALAAALLAGTLTFAPLSAGGAQDARDRAGDPLSKLDPQTRYAVELLLDSAKSAGLPYGPLESKALEGISKRANGRDILAAVRKVYRSLRDARTALGPVATSDELTAGSGALRAGITVAELSKLSSMRDAKVSLTVPLIVLSDLVSRGVARDTASLTINQLMQIGAADDDFLGLWRSVERDIVSGTDPGVALLNRARQMPTRAPPSGPPNTGVRPEEAKA
jgi:hypothetical protein